MFSRVSEVLLDDNVLHELTGIVVLTPVAYGSYVVRIGGVSIATNGRWCTIDRDGAEDTDSGERRRMLRNQRRFHGRASGR